MVMGELPPCVAVWCVKAAVVVSSDSRLCLLFVFGLTLV